MTVSDLFKVFLLPKFNTLVAKTTMTKYGCKSGKRFPIGVTKTVAIFYGENVDFGHANLFLCFDLISRFMVVEATHSSNEPHDISFLHYSKLFIM